MSPSTVLLVLVCVALGVAGQLSLKHGIKALAARPGLEMGLLAQAVLQPYVWLGLALYGISALLWLLVLARAPLSVAYPMLSLGYVAVAILSRLLFAEPLTAAKLLGILLVCFGVALLAQGSS